MVQAHVVQEAPRPQDRPLQSNSGRLKLGHARSFAAVKPTPAPARGKRLKAAMLRHPPRVGRVQLTPDLMATGTYFCTLEVHLLL